MLKKIMIPLFLLLTTACTSIKVNIGAKMTMKHTDELEDSINIRPDFNYLPSKWSPMFKQNMTSAWQKLNIKGINYFTLGKPGFLKGYVSRSDVKSKYYQAWFGTYIIQATNNVFTTPNLKINESALAGIMEYGKVAEHDQIAWLDAMGDKSPFAKSISFNPIEKIEIDGTVVQFFEGIIESHSDLTDKSTSLARLLGMPKSKKWDDNVTANHNITLKGIYGIWYNEADRTIKIVYGCGSIVHLKDGQTVDNYLLLKDELLRMAKNVSFNKLN